MLLLKYQATCSTDGQLRIYEAPDVMNLSQWSLMVMSSTRCFSLVHACILVCITFRFSLRAYTERTRMLSVFSVAECFERNIAHVRFDFKKGCHTFLLLLLCMFPILIHWSIIEGKHTLFQPPFLGRVRLSTLVQRSLHNGC